MTKKNKSKKSHQNHSNKQEDQPATQTDQQMLMVECLQIYEMLQNNSKQLKQQQKCHLLSKKWLNSWKTYVGYDSVSKDNDGKIPKGVGKKHPGKINQGFVKSNHGYLEIPPTLPQYQYLNTVLNDKLDKDEDYIAVSNQLWLNLIDRYQVASDVIRPIRKTKNSYYYDSQLLCFQILILDYSVVDQHLEKYKKINKKDRTTLFDTYKIQASTFWQLQHLIVFFKKLISHVYKQQKEVDIKLWRAFTYLNVAEVQQQLSTNIQNKSYLFQGRPLEEQKYQGLDVDQIIKDSYLILIQCESNRLVPDTLPQAIKGYCQECLKNKQLIQYCMCEQYHYCSTQCRIDDQIFHSKCCQVAFDSEDDDEFDNKKISEEFKGCGLDNLGNTCYMNSTLQCMVGIQEIRQFYGSNAYKADVQNDKTKLSMKMSKFMKQLNSQKNKSISPWAIKGQVNYYLPPFRGFKQHDANDFFTNFINSALNQVLCHPDHLYHKLYQSTLFGTYDSTIHCPDCNVEINSTQVFMQISVPIKQRTKKVFYNYAIIQQNQIIKGKSEVQQNWEKMRTFLKVSPECFLYAGKQCQGLYDLNQQNQTQKQIKSIKAREIIAYPQIKYNEGQKIFIFSTITYKNICNTPMKSQYGYPHLIVCDPRITTIVKFWVKVAEYFHIKHFAQAIVNIQKQYFQLKQSNQKNQAEETNTSQNIQKQKQQDQKNQGQSNFQKALEQYLKDSKIKIFIHDLKKTKGICFFCKKKCDGCLMNIILDQTVEEYFANKIDQVNFTISLPNRFQYPITQTILANSGEPNIQDCLQLFKEAEQLDEQNAWYCSNCDMMRLAIKQMTIKQYPKIFVIQLNRFKTHNQKKTKNSQPIEYKQIQRFGQEDYRLIGVIVHQGSIDAGHYWAISYRDNKYYIFNDDKVSQTEKIVNKNAYILFYRRM